MKKESIGLYFKEGKKSLESHRCQESEGSRPLRFCMLNMRAPPGPGVNPSLLLWEVVERRRGEGQSYRPFHNSARPMDAICIQAKHRLFWNSTSFIQMNDGPRNSAPRRHINIHQRPAPLTKSGDRRHLLFK